MIFECAKTTRKSWDLLHRSCWVAPEISTLRTSPRMEVPLVVYYIILTIGRFLSVLNILQSVLTYMSSLCNKWAVCWLHRTSCESTYICTCSVSTLLSNHVKFKKQLRDNPRLSLSLSYYSEICTVRFLNPDRLAVMQARLWACGRGDTSTSSFGIYLNPISTRGGQIMPTLY